MSAYDVAANLQQNPASFKTLLPPIPFFFVGVELSPWMHVRSAPIALPPQTHRTNQIAFDKTELTYYSEPNKTPSKPQPQGDTPMRETHPTPTTSLAGPPYDHTSGASSLLPPATKPGKIRQNPTKSDGNSCVRVRARAREETERSFPSLCTDCPQLASDWTLRRSRRISSFLPGLVIPASTHVIPAKAGI